MTLFNALPAPLPTQGSTDSPLQLSILLRLASLAKAHTDDLSIVAPSLLRLPSYLSTWALVGSSTGAQAVAEVSSTLSAGGRTDDAFAVALAYLRSAGSLSEPVAPIAVNLALSLPDFFDWEVLESLDPVKSYLASSSGSAKSQAALLQALKAGDAKAVSSALSSADFDAQTKERIEKKAKLVALAELCAPRVGGEVKYEEIKERLGLAGSIEEDDGMEVEEWVINGKPTLFQAGIECKLTRDFVCSHQGASHRGSPAPTDARRLRDLLPFAPLRSQRMVPPPHAPLLLVHLARLPSLHRRAVSPRGAEDPRRRKGRGGEGGAGQEGQGGGCEAGGRRSQNGPADGRSWDRSCRLRCCVSSRVFLAVRRRAMHPVSLTERGGRRC